MRTIELIQGSPEWHAHRASHWNASDAPVMLGVSPHASRLELMHALHTGVGREFSAYLQKILDDGHRSEALARPLAEQIVGEELYPCVGAEGRYSASFDGLTLLEDVAFEHKTPNDAIRAAFGAPMEVARDANGVRTNVVTCRSGERRCRRSALRRQAVPGVRTNVELPEYLRAQMEHQLLVSGAQRVLFGATAWNDQGECVEQHWCWYTPNSELRHRTVAGWAQFERDLANYQPAVDAPRPVPTPVAGFGSLSLRVEGRVLASNLDTFRAGAEAFIARLPKPAELQTDQDFVDAEGAVKACADAESRIKSAKDAALAQMADVEAVMRTADEIAEAIRSARLALEKAVKAEKESRKADLVRAGVLSVIEHYAGINATLSEFALSPSHALTAEIGASIKGLKTLASMRNAIDGAVAAAKIAASQQANRVRSCIAQLPTDAALLALFPDRVALCHAKAPDDLAMLVNHRIDEHAKREARRIAEAEERGRQMAEVAAQRQREDAEREEERKRHLLSARVRLGEINALISPLSISAEGLAQLGFPHVGTDRAAKLYEASQLPAMRAAMTRVVAGVREAA